MKKIFSLLTVFALVASITFAATTPPVKPPVLDAKQIMLPIGKTGSVISLMDLAYIRVKDYETVSGRKLNLVDKVGFKLGQRKLRQQLNADGTVKDGAVKKYASKITADGETGFHIGGFALGFLLGLIGVLIAYLINDDKKSNRVKWAWLGVATVLVLVLLGALL